MPVVKKRDEYGFMQPSAKCAYATCTTPAEPMPHDDRYTRIVSPETGEWYLEPDGARLPAGWSIWHSGDGEEIILCESCGLSLRPVFSLPPR